MKKIKIETIFILITFPIAIIFILLYLRDIKNLQSQKDKVMVMADSVRYLSDANRYYSDLVKFGNKSSEYSLENKDMKVYDISQDTTKSIPVAFNTIIKQNRYSLILRYTEIGCNECSDLTIKKLNKLHQLRPDLPIYALVDFTNYDSYLQWRKIGVIDFPVFFLKKGGIVFDNDCKEFSYLFMVDNRCVASSFFIPNSGMPFVLDDYFESIHKKKS